MILTLLLLSLSTVNASEAGLEKISPINPNCTEIEAQARKLDPKEGREPLPQNQVDTAIEWLGKIRPPRSEDLNAMTIAMEKDVATAAGPYIKWLSTRCLMATMKLRRALVSTAAAKSTSPEVRKRIVSILKESLIQTDTPTYLDARLNALVLERGQQSGLWILSAKDQQAFKELNEKILQGRARDGKFKTTHSELEKLVEAGAKSSTIRATAGYAEWSEGLLEEIRTSREFLARLRAMIKAQ